MLVSQSARLVTQPDRKSRTLSRTQLQTDLEHALVGEQFYLVYQPQVRASSGEVVGFEALIRWRHPSGERISPTRFVPLLEQSGQIDDVGLWVLETACRQAATWRANGLEGLCMSVNLSPEQFRRADVATLVTRTLGRAKLPAKNLSLEITEGLLMEDTDATRVTLQHLHGMGVSLAIDDFGTGYSSLGYLRRFPVNTLKIDHTFIPEITSNANVASIVRTILSLGRSLRLEVIAEGIETDEQFALLRDLGCDTIQGYFIGKPVTVDEFPTWLDTHEHWRAQVGLASGKYRSPSAGLASFTSGRTILLVEDDDDMRTHVAGLLASRGLGVVEAATLADAFDRMHEHRAQLSMIITDIELPDGIGLDLLQAREREKLPCGVIVMTGFGTMEHAITALRHGVADFLTKPFSSRDLDQALRRALRQTI